MTRPDRCDNVKVTLRYICAATVALLLTVSTPRTRLWSLGEAHEVSQTYATLNGEALLELLVLSALTIISFLCVQGSDPGYLSQDVMSKACAHFESLNRVESKSRLSLLGDFGAAEMEIELSPSTGALEGEHQSLVSDVTSIDNGASKSMLRLYCPRCKFAPPLRAHHCKHCDVCVATFDHHCHFIGTCIGERNHCRFWWFLTFQMLSFFVMVSIVNSKKKPLGFDGNEADEVPGIVMVIFSSLYLWPLTFFATLIWATHTYFALTNSTSFEFVKAPHLEYLHGTNEFGMPFSKGIDGNVRTFCCLRDTTWAIFVGDNSKSWIPTMWEPPGVIDHNSEDWFENVSTPFKTCQPKEIILITNAYILIIAMAK